MIVVTAGHVDHGKTQLVKAITGIDTDTLAEEKRRGLTIDIGFAYLPVEGHPSIGFIDVPGHDRFVKNALCGLSAADFVLLVIAADDGAMPQTEEHLSIIDLLNIRHGAIVFSKIDRVSVGRIDAVKTQIDTLSKNTTLENWPKYLVSSVSRQGIEELRNFLVQQVLTEDSKKVHYLTGSNFRMAIDRSFDKKGTGLVVTGTIFSGIVSIGDPVTIAGTGMRLRVRGLRIQNSESDCGQQGQRCAINLAGADLRKDQVKRGCWVTSETVAEPVDRFDAEIRIIKNSSKPLTHWTPVHLHHASSETTARVAVLEKKPIKPGQSGLVQIVSALPLGAAFGDYFIIRDQSARVTLGGGRVIDIFPPKRGRSRPERIARLKKLHQNDAQAALKALLVSCQAGVDLDQFVANRNLTAAISGEEGMVVMYVGNRRIGFSKEMLQTHCQSILQALEKCHQHSPDASGFSETGLLRQTKFQFPTSLLKIFLDRLLHQSSIENNRGGYSLAKNQTSLSAEDKARWQAISKAMESAGNRGMSVTEVLMEIDLPLKDLNLFLSRISRSGLIVKLSASLYILPSCLTRIRKVIEQQTRKNGDQAFTVAEFRNVSGVGRNRCIEILECFDVKGITKRIGQGRQLLPTAADAFEKFLEKID